MVSKRACWPEFVFLYVVNYLKLHFNLLFIPECYAQSWLRKRLIPETCVAISGGHTVKYQKQAPFQSRPNIESQLLLLYTSSSLAARLQCRRTMKFKQITWTKGITRPIRRERPRMTRRGTPLLTEKPPLVSRPLTQHSQHFFLKTVADNW